MFPKTPTTRSSPKGVRIDREQEVIEQVRKCGGFSVFWVTENKARARAADSLVERGVLVDPGKDSGYPWCDWRLREGV